MCLWSIPRPQTSSYIGTSTATPKYIIKGLSTYYIGTWRLRVNSCFRDVGIQGCVRLRAYGMNLVDRAQKKAHKQNKDRDIPYKPPL